jgi:hypothetical protein
MEHKAHPTRQLRVPIRSCRGNESKACHQRGQRPCTLCIPGPMASVPVAWWPWDADAAGARRRYHRRLSAGSIGVARLPRVNRQSDDPIGSDPAHAQLDFHVSGKFIMRTQADTNETSHCRTCLDSMCSRLALFAGCRLLDAMADDHPQSAPASTVQIPGRVGE